MIENIKQRFDLLYVTILFTTCAISITLIFYLYQVKEDKEKAFYSESIATLDIAYRASMEKYKLLAQMVFRQNIQQKNIGAFLSRFNLQEHKTKYI